MKNDFIIYIRIKTETANIDFLKLLLWYKIEGRLLCSNQRTCGNEMCYSVTMNHSEGARLKKILDRLEAYEAFELYEFVRW